MSGHDCASCSLSSGVPGPHRLGLHQQGLQRLGRADAAGAPVVALAGNPNTGKSTLFNALTGLRQRVGNWTGTTVVRSEGSFRFEGVRYRLVDLPGIQSLAAVGKDEEVARDYLLFEPPDVTVVVVDATALERNLPLVLQVLQITDRVVVAVNLVDEAKRRGLGVDVRHLTRELGVPVVAVSARTGEGMPALLASITSVAGGQVVARPRRGAQRDSAVLRLSTLLRVEFPGLPNTEWLALRLLEGDASVTDAVLDGRLGRLVVPVGEQAS